MDEKEEKKFLAYRKAFVIQALRRASFRWKPRNEAKNKARLHRGIYLCASCNSEIKPKDIKMDHKDPVVNPVTGFAGWDEYITRMLCKSEGFQVICTQCHEAKTFTEKEMRKIYRQERKNRVKSIDRPKKKR